MNRILFLLVALTVGLSETILIPEDFATIQEGIDASVDGDTVLVADGDYVENLVLDKSIVLTSHAIYDNLDDWIIFDDYYFNQWVINNSHIENTRLIGFSPDDPDYGSVILITPDSEECISPEIVGFTIQGGSGTTVVRQTDEGEINVVLGGGILADVSDPHIHHNAFENNGSNDVYSGGAAQLTSSAEDWSFDNRFEDYNPRCDVEEFRLSDNLYNGNDAQYGNSMANRFHEDEFDMSGSIFDVFDCGNEESAVSTIWVKVEPAASVDYDDGAGQTCAFTAPHVYVDPSIPQECLDEGCGFLNNPFKTIVRALELINPTEDNPITIHLATGTYSPESGESFPLNMISNVNIEGEDEETTILDAQQTGTAFLIEDCDNNSIAGITITGGTNYGMLLYHSSPTLTHVTITNNTADYDGGGMNLYYSNPTLTNVTITNNTADYDGGGMHLYYSNPTLTNVTISNNTALEVDGRGGGMYLNESNPTLTNVTISDNTANYGGGMYLTVSNFTLLTHVTISNNTADYYGGGMLIEGNWMPTSSDPILTHVTITGNTANNGGGMYLFSHSNPTLTNSIIWDNSPESYVNDATAEPLITYSDIEGGWEGEGNIDTDPLFTDPENGDYTLQEGSPCIDAGTADIDGDGVDDITDYVGSAPDMGAYELGWIAVGDFNYDMIIDILDMIIGINELLSEEEPSFEVNTIGDFNGDGIYDILDFTLMTLYYLYGETGHGGTYATAANIMYTDRHIFYSANGDLLGVHLTLEHEDVNIEVGIAPAHSTFGESNTYGIVSEVVIVNPVDYFNALVTTNGDFTIIEAIAVSTDYLDVTIGALGCTDEEAFNYNSEAIFNSEDCEYNVGGDTNFDGIVDILDIILGISIILGNTDSTDEQLNVLDMNQDGDVNVIDIVEMINYILDR